MSVTANYSKYRLSNLKIAFVAFLVITIWFAYDGYYSESFIEKHTNIVETEDGEIREEPNATLVFNRKFPYFGIPVAIAAAAAFFILKDKKLVAQEDGLKLSSGKLVPYEEIDELDYTDFEQKGKFYFVCTSDAEKKRLTFSNKTWDGLDELLEYLISKMS